jgi:hypothetical protein
MSKQARIVQPDLHEIPREIVDLAAAIGQLAPEHRERIDPVLARVIDSTKRRRRILSLVQDALSQLRLQPGGNGTSIAASMRNTPDPPNAHAASREQMPRPRALRPDVSPGRGASVLTWMLICPSVGRHGARGKSREDARWHQPMIGVSSGPSP